MALIADELERKQNKTAFFLLLNLVLPRCHKQNASLGTMIKVFKGGAAHVSCMPSS